MSNISTRGVGPCLPSRWKVAFRGKSEQMRVYIVRDILKDSPGEQATNWAEAT